jgi:hypothetical protein
MTSPTVDAPRYRLSGSVPLPASHCRHVAHLEYWSNKFYIHRMNNVATAKYV